jgi:hypothetical protein
MGSMGRIKKHRDRLKLWLDGQVGVLTVRRNRAPQLKAQGSRLKAQGLKVVLCCCNSARVFPRHLATTRLLAFKAT